MNEQTPLTNQTPDPYENKNQSIFVADRRQLVNTSLRRANEIRYAIDTELAKRNRDNYFALERMDTSTPDKFRSKLGQAWKATKSFAVDTAQTLYRTAKGQWEEIKLSNEQSNANMLASQKFAFDVQAAKQHGATDEEIHEMERRFKQENDALNRMYENLRAIGRQSMAAIKANHERYLEQAGLKRDEQDGWIFDLITGFGSVGVALGASAAFQSPLAGAILFGELAGQKDYEEALENGVSPKRALAIGIAGGSMEAILEEVGLENLHAIMKGKSVLDAGLKHLPRREQLKAALKTAIKESADERRKGILRAGFEGFLNEAGQEGLQQTAEEIIMQNFAGREKEMQDTFKDIVYSAWLGGLTGFGFGATGRAATKLLGEKGVPPKVAKALVDLAQEYAVSEPMQQAAKDVMHDVTSALNYPNSDVVQGAQEWGKAVEQAKNIDRETRREIYNIADRTEEAARKQGFSEDEVQAIGALTQTRANIVYDAAGIKPGTQFKLTEVQFENEQHPAQPDPATAIHQLPHGTQEFTENKNGLEVQHSIIVDGNITGEGMTWTDFKFNYSADTDKVHLGNMQLTPNTDISTLIDMPEAAVGKVHAITLMSYQDGRVVADVSFSDFDNKLQHQQGAPKQGLYDFINKQTQQAPSAQQTRQQADAEYERQRQEYLARKAEEERLAAELADQKLAELPEDFDFSLTQEAYDETGKADTNSPAFKQWFKNSKVVDENGKPLIVYHGTDANFTAFDMSKGRANMDIQGAFFSPWELDAKGYGSRVGAYYLSIQNPADEATGYAALRRFQGQNEAGKKAKAYLQSLGYDGVINNNEEYIAFEPTQIKSVDNRGTFDPNNANVFYQESPLQNHLTEQDRPVATINSKDYGFTGTLKEVKNKLVTWYRKNLQGKPANSPQLGKVRFTGAGISEVRGKNFSKRKANLMPAAKDIIEKGRVVGSQDQSNREDNIVRFHYVQGKVLLDGEEVVVQIDVAEDHHGNKFYFLSEIENAGGLARVQNTGSSGTDSVSNNAAPVKPLDGNTFFQPAYNGSPHKFNEFSLSAIGTGEGNAAHGWGLYFAQDKAVGDGYRRALATQSILYKGKILEDDQLAGYLYNMLPQIHPATTEKLRAYVKERIQEIKQDIKEAQDTLNDTNVKYKWNNAKWQLETYTQRLEKLQALDLDQLTLDQGQLYKVEIPDTDVMLDEEKSFYEQPQAVKDALYAIAREQSPELEYILDSGDAGEMTGWDIYHLLARQFATEEDDDYNMGHSQSGMREASLLLNQYGVKGITYQGAQDGRCFVVFDDQAVTTLETFYQDVQPLARGSVTFNPRENQAVIKAFKNADPSTVVHELSHVLEHDMLRAEKISNEEEFLGWMRELRGIYADSAEWALDWVKNTTMFSPATRAYLLEEIQKRGGIDYVKQYAENGNLLDPKTDVEIVLKHAFSERFATQFEAYLKNGKAPNEAYKGLFEKFAQWLRQIYQNVAGKLELDPRVEAFFDKIMVRQAAKLDSKVFSGKVAQLKEQVANIRAGNPSGDFTLEELKAFVDLADAPAPRLPGTHLFKDLKRYGANYAAAGRIDKEVFKQKFIFNKKGGVGDDPYRWLADHGYMNGEGTDSNLTYEELDRLNEQAYDMIERALDGEKIYPIGTEQQVEEYNNYKELMDTFKEVFGSVAEAKKVAKSILALEEKGYRVVEKKDLTALSLRLGELNKLADRLDNKSQTVRQKEEAKKATLDAAQKIKRRVVDELNKREIEGKAEIVKNLQSAKTFDDIQTATAQALDFLEDAYDKTEAGQEERRRTDLPNTNWDNVRAQLLRAYTESVGQVDERVREAWKVRTAITTGSTSLYGWDADEVQRRRQQSEKILAEAEPKLEAALMRATSKVLFNIGGLESDQIRRLLSFYGKSATRQRALYKGNIDSLVRQAQALQEDNYKKYMNKKIQDILNLNLFDKRGNLRKATVDQYTLASLQELKRVANLGPQSAADELAARMDRFSNGEIEATPTDKIINEMLSIQAYDRKDVSVQLYKQAYEDIANLRRHGRSTKNLQKMIMDFQTEQDKSDVLKAVAKNKEAGTLKRMYASWIANWESFLDLATDNATKEKYSMLNLEADTITYSWQRRTEIMDGVKEIYKLGSNREVQNKMNQLRKEKHTFTNYAHVDKSDDPYHIKRTGEAFQEELSKMQIITAYIYYQNDNLADRLTQQYGNEQLGAMWNLLDKQDIELAKFLQRQAEKSYAQINEVFVKERGYDLPRVQNYFPSVTERVESELDFLHAAQVMSKNPSFTKMRASSPFIQMRLENPFGILFRHIDRAADYHFKAEKLNQIRRVFKSPVVKPAIIEKVGEDVYKRMLELIDQFSVTKPRLNYDMDKLGDWLTNNYVKGAIALKPTIAIKQLVSSINYAEQMPTTQWIAGFTDAIMHPKQTVKFMMEGDPYLKARYESGSMNEALARATADANAITAKGKFLRFTDLLTINTRLGDVGAIMFGGKPYVDYLMKEKKMTKEKAFAEFRKATLRSQQANTRSSLSTLQARDMNFLVRGLFAFKNTPAQYARKIADAISQYQRGEIDKKQLAKVVAIYGLLNSWMYSMLTSLGLLAWYFDSDDADELLTEELFFSPFTQMATALPVLDMAVGQAANVAKAKLFDHSVRLERPELPVVSELFKMGGKVLKEEVSAEDVLDMLVTGGQIFGGLPTQYAKGIYTGAADTITGENPMRGFLQALGYTENRAQIATNTKE